MFATGIKTQSGCVYCLIDCAILTQIWLAAPLWLGVLATNTIYHPELMCRGPGFLAAIWFGSSHTPPPPPTPVSKQSLSLSLPVCRRSSLYRARICKRLRSPGIDSASLCSLAGRNYKKGWRTGPPGWESILGLLKGLKYRLWRENAKGVGKEPKSYDREKAWSSINHTVLSAVDRTTVCRRVHHSEDRSDWQYCELCAKPFLFLSDLKAHLGRCQQGKSLAFRHQRLVLSQYLLYLCAKPFLFLSDLKAHLGRCQQGKSAAFRHQRLVFSLAVSTNAADPYSL